MTELRRYLHDDDPIRREPGLPRAEAERMRRLVVSAARDDRKRISLTAFALVTGLSGMAAIAVWTAGETPLVRTTSPTPSVVASVSEAPSRQQLQFATPGGTRVIWVFNSQFQER